MMSPLSLAKFAKPGQLEFDIVVVDEASQMKPKEALGALLRTKQIVVVGDANQLPPTDFFNRSADTVNSDDDFEDIDDESILEACEKTFREVRPLKWHYRSRCESLIAFSNAEFYRNSLITFPMARPGSFSVDLVRVDGTYQARRNVAEAVRVAEESIQFMRRFAKLSEETIPTLGVVSVNIDQRDLIQEELRRLSAGDELVERYCEKAQKRGRAVVRQKSRKRAGRRTGLYLHLAHIWPRAGCDGTQTTIRTHQRETGAPTPERPILPCPYPRGFVCIVRIGGRKAQRVERKRATRPEALPGIRREPWPRRRGKHRERAGQRL
jgi:AAA domain